MAKVMRADRTIADVDDEFMLANASLLMYAQALDGVYVPVCDADQYARGDRPAVQTGGVDRCGSDLPCPLH